MISVLSEYQQATGKFSSNSKRSNLLYHKQISCSIIKIDSTEHLKRFVIILLSSQISKSINYISKASKKPIDY